MRFFLMFWGQNLKRCKLSFEKLWDRMLVLLVQARFLETNLNLICCLSLFTRLFCQIWENSKKCISQTNWVRFWTQPDLLFWFGWSLTTFYRPRKPNRVDQETPIEFTTSQKLFLILIINCGIKPRSTYRWVKNQTQFLFWVTI